MRTIRLTLIACLVSFSCIADVTLPKIFSSNMVVQRDREIKVWGWAGKGESVTVTFNGKKGKAKADANGNWMVKLPAMTHGGPYVFTVAGKSNTLTLDNVLIGDVWLGSGQSNMEWVIKSTNNPDKEIAEGNYPKIRLFTVTKGISFVPFKDLKGAEWQECNAQTVGDFSAVAYFFGRKLHQELDIPIGLINSSWGGTNVQTWISWDVMSQKPQYKDTNIKDLEAKSAQQQEAMKKYQEALKNEKGDAEKWFIPSTSTESWKKIEQPKMWEASSIGNVDGIIWFRKEFEVPASMAGKPATISLGAIDDNDQTYINGVLVGQTNQYNKPRLYTIEPSLLKAGRNVVVIKEIDTGGGGGMSSSADQLYVEADGKKISLAGEWLYRSSVNTAEFGMIDVGPNSFPSQLYNSMIAPFISFGIKGVIWYQGESNTWQAHQYRTLFADLIKDWRSKWGYEFPFYWVQLANYMKPAAAPVDSDWAELREAQSMTLALPQTGQAVIIDIGEADDIHPRNKQDVGLRLALAALKTTYGKDIVYSGPVYQSMKVDGNKIVVSFTNIGSGLITRDKYGYVKGFAIAGADKKFVWAKAHIEGNTVVVYSDAVKNPVAVRYAWGNNPDDASLYNKELLPASPFRTDTWLGITEGK
jgi:sialate O-acetylesterase